MTTINEAKLTEFVTTQQQLNAKLVDAEKAVENTEKELAAFEKIVEAEGVDWFHVDDLCQGERTFAEVMSFYQPGDTEHR